MRGFDKLRQELDASGTETLIVLTSEHWANFFLDHIGAFCIGKAESYSGPIEPWLKIEKQTDQGRPAARRRADRGGLRQRLRAELRA